jgi:hypothetical protein
LLNQALSQTGLDRTSIYLTNAVNHFKHEQRGKRRLHKRTNRDQVQQCRWWSFAACDAILSRSVRWGRTKDSIMDRPGLAIDLRDVALSTTHAAEAVYRVDIDFS